MKHPPSLLCKFFLWTALGALLLFLLHFGWQRKIYAYDGMEYIYNGRAIATGGELSSFAPLRHPLLQFFYGGIFLIFGSFVSGPNMVWALGLLALIITAVMVFLCYRLFQKSFSPLLSLFLSLLLFSNRLVVHYASEPMNDMVGIILILGAFFFCQRDCKEKKGLWNTIFTALFLGFAIGARHPMGLWLGVFFLVIGFQCFKKQITLGQGGLKALLLGTISLGVAGGVEMIYFYFIEGKWDFLFFLKVFHHLTILQNITASFPTETPWDYFIFVWESMGPLVCLFVVGGLVHSYYSHSKRDTPHILSLVCFFVVMSSIMHKEGRYLLPALPFLYFFAGRGIERVLKFIENVTPRIKKTIPYFLFFAIILSSGWPFLKEILTLQDPLYRSNLVSRVSTYLKEKSPGRKIFYAGDYYSLRPKKYPQWYHFTKYCEFYHFYHIFRFQLALYGGVKIHKRTYPKVLYLSKNHPFVKNSLFEFGKKSLVIYGMKKTEYSTYLVKPSPPLIVAEQNSERLSKKGEYFSSPHFRFQIQGEKIRILRGIFPFELYTKVGDHWKALGMVTGPEKILLYWGKGLTPLAIGPKIWERKNFPSPTSLLVVYQKYREFYR